MNTLSDLLRAAAENWTEGVQFLDVREQQTGFTYAQLVARARSAAGQLLEIGVLPGDTVAIILPTGVAFYDAFFGAILAGAQVAPLYPPAQLGQLDEYSARTAAMLRAARARIVLTEKRISRLLGETCLLAPLDLGVHCLDARAPAELPPWSQVPVQVDSRGTVLIQFSSGTTQAPKPVALSHKALLANIEAIRRAITLGAAPEGGTGKHRVVSWLPLYHDMGLIGCLLTCLAEQADLTLLPPQLFVARPAAWLRAISSRRASVSAAPNFAYAWVAHRVSDADLAGLDLSSWQVALNGAEVTTESAMDAFCERLRCVGFNPNAMTPVYGLAEATLAVTFGAPGKAYVAKTFAGLAWPPAVKTEAFASSAPEKPRRLVSVGRPLAGVTIQIRREGNTVATQGEVGSIWVSGPSVMTEYLHLPEQTASALQGGWLDTGDLGLVVEEELYVVGRRKDVVLIRGRNYAPQPIEAALEQVPSLRRGCAVAVSYLPEGAATEVLLVFAERRARDATAIATIQIEARIAVTKATGLATSDVVIMEPGTLPRTSSGKLRRSETLLRWQAGRLATPRRPTLWRLAYFLLRSSFFRTRAWARRNANRILGRKSPERR